MTGQDGTTPTTRLSRSTAEAIYYRDLDLVGDVIGQRSFVEIFYRQTIGRDPTAEQSRMLDAVLVVLMEHGLTPSATAARLVYSSSPENLQAGVAAGLLAVGSRFIGTAEGCAALLDEVAASEVPADAADRLAAEYRKKHEPVPGFGHHIHRPDDPRSVKLLELAQETGTAGRRQDALVLLAAAVDRHAGKHITINTTGAVAAILRDIGIPATLVRGVAVLSRAAGLVAHLAEEQVTPIDRYLWSRMDELIPFES
ncbi:citryl-CoA lyase [Subtercola boreus]|uniref:citrate synthase (unknown stereospecificity) n=1 Tax=Subtercola boreus TaxID=120213 RepID=A0A3E0VB84_9MICO|nr:citryl-CoA lyase [Subtercola boreus]RFA07001.1 citryl-CoA lyase [Subtercola boreus]